MKIYNNLTRQKEEFKTLEPGKVKFYSCGPTTYDFLHVGNARALVVGDLFFRALKALGYQVNFVRNFTDVDDKIIERAHSLGVSALEHAERFLKECEKDMASLGMDKPSASPRVSETMPEIIAMIETLMERGVAYEVQGEVLYHVPSFKEYGKLSRKDLGSLEHGHRVQVESHKQHPSDFVLWKPAKEGEVSWDSPWGPGRPGWHIECSAMAKKHLGPEIDLHHGGVDLMFPHHENEIAQSEAANQCPFCHCWCHNEFLNFATEKMSKSLGNVITIRQFVESYGGAVLRQVLMSVHYRSKMEWGQALIERGIQDVERLCTFQLELQRAHTHHAQEGPNQIPELEGVVAACREELSQDFNVPGALAKIFQVVRQMNQKLLDQTGRYQNREPLNSGTFERAQEMIVFATEALGCFYGDPQRVWEECQKARQSLTGSSLEKAEIEALIHERREARKARDFKRSDEIRDQLSAQGIILKDAPDGSTTWQYE